MNEIDKMIETAMDEIEAVTGQLYPLDRNQIDIALTNLAYGASIEMIKRFAENTEKFVHEQIEITTERDDETNK